MLRAFLDVNPLMFQVRRLLTVFHGALLYFAKSTIDQRTASLVVTAPLSDPTRSSVRFAISICAGVNTNVRARPASTSPRFIHQRSRHSERDRPSLCMLSDLESISSRGSSSAGCAILGNPLRPEGQNPALIDCSRQFDFHAWYSTS